MRPLVSASILLVAVTAATLLVGGSGQPPDDSIGGEIELVEVSDTDSLWPYTSRSRSVEGRTLAINVLVRDDPDRVGRSLRGLDDADWEPANEAIEEPNVTIETGAEEVELVWTDAHGSTRFTYVDTDGEGRWLDEHEQLHTGTYLATRDHARVYARDDANWTALQVHREYWDWFRLRHTVTDVVESRRALVDGITGRTYRTGTSPEATGDGPGLTTVDRVGFLAIALALPVAVSQLVRRVEWLREEIAQRPALTLGLFVLAVPPGVRAAGVIGELALAGYSPKFVVAPLYLVLAIGLPLGTTQRGDGLRPSRAFGVTAGAFLAGIAIDLLAIGLVVPPWPIIVNRVTLALGLGTLAAGSAAVDRRRRVFLATGALTWAWGLLTPLGLFSF